VVLTRLERIQRVLLMLRTGCLWMMMGLGFWDRFLF